MIVISIGYEEYVFNREDGIKMMELLEKAERYERKYWSKEEREKRSITADYTYHVFPNEKQYGMQLISDDLYRMAKLAGKPEKES